jgi:hypothetical protein
MAGGGGGGAVASSRDAMPEVGHLPPNWSNVHVRPARPIGVAVLAVVIGLIGLVLLLAGGLFLINSYSGGVIPGSVLIVHSVSQIGAALLFLLGAILMAVATALWRQEAWALYTTVVVTFAGLTFLFFTGAITYLFLILLVVFVYLLVVRRHFY